MKAIQEAIAKNWPTISAGVLMIGIFIAKNRGILTPDQAEAIMASLGVGGMLGTHRMTYGGATQEEKP